MKYSLLVIMFVFVGIVSCTKNSPIDNILKQVESDPDFGNGPYKKFRTPPNAPLNDVLKQAFSNHFPLPISAYDMILL